LTHSPPAPAGWEQGEWVKNFFLKGGRIMRWIDEQLVKYGETKRELEIAEKVNFVLLIIGLVAEIGLITGFIWSPIVYAGSLAVLSITLPIVVVLSIRCDKIRHQYASLRQELRINED